MYQRVDSAEELILERRKGGKEQERRRNGREGRRDGGKQIRGKKQKSRQSVYGSYMHSLFCFF